MATVKDLLDVLGYAAREAIKSSDKLNNESSAGQTDTQPLRRTDIQVDKQTDIQGQTDRKSNRRADRPNRQVDRQTDTDRKTNRRTDRRNRQADRHTDR